MPTPATSRYFTIRTTVPRPFAPGSTASSSTIARMIGMPIPPRGAVERVGLVVRRVRCLDAVAVILDGHLQACVVDHEHEAHVTRGTGIRVPHGVPAGLRDGELEIGEQLVVQGQLACEPGQREAGEQQVLGPCREGQADYAISHRSTPR